MGGNTIRRKTGRTTLKDIAQVAGLSVSTVSDVLRKRTGKVKVSEKTSKRVFALAKDLGYEPNSAAHALVTGRTCNIGFLLSDRTTLGLANYYFATYLSGVEAACKERGYACVVSAYDLSSVKNLVTPAKLRKNSVDGIIITGYVESAVLDVLARYNVPFLLLGGGVDQQKSNVLMVARDIAEEWLELFKYLYQTGCTKIGIADIEAKRIQQSLRSAISRFESQYGDAVAFTIYEVPYDVNQFDHAEQVAAKWLAQDPNTRPDGIISHDQWCVGFLSEIIRAGVTTPDEVSVVSTIDTVHCRHYHPRLSALAVPLFEHACDITHLFADYIEEKIDFHEAERRALQLKIKGTLVVRETSRSVH